MFSFTNPFSNKVEFSTWLTIFAVHFKGVCVCVCVRVCVCVWAGSRERTQDRLRDSVDASKLDSFSVAGINVNS